MHYISRYNSQLGEIILAADNIGLVGLWFGKEKYCLEGLDEKLIEKETEIIKRTKHWLDIYFKGIEPNFTLPLNPTGSEFRKQVWEILKKIPYGKTITYNDIAVEIAKCKGIKKMSAQAVGGAVGHNRISIIIPCHRVIGANFNLVGYAGGIDKKLKLLELEGCKIEKFKLPK